MTQPSTRDTHDDRRATADSRPGDEDLVVAGPACTFRLRPAGFRFRLERPDGSVIAHAHPDSGIVVRRTQRIGSDGRSSQAGGAVVAVSDIEMTESRLHATVWTADRTAARVRVAMTSHGVHIQVDPSDEGLYSIVVRTAGVGPLFGLADHAAFSRTTTDVTGFVTDGLTGESGPSPARLVSSFVIAPRSGFASVNVYPGPKIVRFTEDEHAQGSRDVRRLSALHYFVGTTASIYEGLREVRQAAGSPFHPPAYDAFGVGWEAWGALGWMSNQRTVAENIERYLELGFPLRWAVIGSGFWPQHDPRLRATTSFGMWDSELYPDPRGLIARLHERGIKVLLGLRIAFITDGPFAAEGVEGGYFLKNPDGTEPIVFNIHFPRRPAYLLDPEAPGAVDWYLDLCGRWLDFGVDGFKEDLFGFGVFGYVLSDDKVEAINSALMGRGVMVMGRNGTDGTSADMHRINDFNHAEWQDRGPLNSLALAYSGFDYVYPDVVGGIIDGEELPDTSGPTPPTREQVGRYLMRSARFASVHPCMGFGSGPWNVADEQVGQVMLESARLHGRLQPYIYSAAIDTHRSGFPHALTPLPLAYPDDDAVFGLENSTRRGYQWLIGDALLATPLYGDDLATAETRDVYLPAGRWIDYDSGEAFDGPATLTDFPIPVTKTPLFIGRSGILVEEVDGRLEARVYPVALAAELDFHHPDGRDTEIRVRVGSWTEEPRVTRGDGGRVPTTRRGVAIAFEIEPGVDYAVE